MSTDVCGFLAESSIVKPDFLQSSPYGVSLMNNIADDQELTDVLNY